jgi:hypothetical protein
MVSFSPLLLYPREKSPSTHWIRDWVGSRVDLDAVEKRDIFALLEIEPRLCSP